jgi:hypothetical protein
MKKLLVTAVAAFAFVGGGAIVAEQVSPGDSLAAGCTDIGYQNGVAGAAARMKKLDPGGFNALGTGAWDKFFRTAKKLVDDHDAVCGAAAPPPTTTAPPPPPPTTTAPAPRFNPQAYNRGSRGLDARYCVQFNDGLRYDDGGREIDGLRTGKFVPGLKPADEMDGREPCDPDGAGHPPYPAASYER